MLKRINNIYWAQYTVLGLCAVIALKAVLGLGAVVALKANHDNA